MTVPHYRVCLSQPRTQTFHVTLTLPQPAAVERISLPVWIAGSYLVREFSKSLHSLTAHCAGVAAEVVQHSKNTWDIHCPPAPDGAAQSAPLVISYQITACDASVRSAWLSAQRGFFNGTSLFVRAHSRQWLEQHLHIERPSGEFARWQVASSAQPLAVDGDGWGTYTFESYENLVDTPFELGHFWSAHFDVLGVPHRFVVTGAPAGFDGERLVRDTQRICQTQIAFWHPAYAKMHENTPKITENTENYAQTPSNQNVDLGRGCAGADLARPPHTRYVFLLHVSAGGYGGLEHRESTALICDYGDLPMRGESPDEGKAEASAQQPATGGYRTLLGLISHEYFHTWNVKRLRPQELQRIDFERENFTSMLWFFEGLTSYYDDLLLHRAGLIDEAGYVELLGKTLAQVFATPGRHIQSSAQASLEAWTKYYRPDEHSPNTTVSYYTKGALIGLCMDLQLRRMSAGAIGLDHVMRTLWLRSAGGAIGERDVVEALLDLSPTVQSKLPQNTSENNELTELSTADWPALLQRWVHGTQDLPVAALLGEFGVRLEFEPPTWAQRLGLRVREVAGQPIEIKHVLRNSPAEAAGFLAGDRWWAIELPDAHGNDDGNSSDSDAWAIAALDDLQTFAAGQHHCTALVQRARRVLRLPLALHGAAAPSVGTPKLRIVDMDKLRPWLQ